MAKLIMNPHSAARRDVALPRTILSIGRDPSNDLVLPDAMVSRRHALIECRGSQFFLRDCNSSNGSLVNGDRVSERSLRDGDLVAIGAARLLFREELELGDSGGKVVQHPSSPRLQCPSCRADFRKGDVFCRQCGGRVQEVPAKVVCVACGTAVPLPARFCNACGGRLGREEPAAGLDAGLGEAAGSGVNPEGVTVPAKEPVAEPAQEGVPLERVPAHDDTPQPAPPVESASVPPAVHNRTSAVSRSRGLSEPAFEHPPAILEPVRERPATAPSRPRLVPPLRVPVEARQAPIQAPVASAGARGVATLVDVVGMGALQALVLLPVLWRRAEPDPASWGYVLLATGLGLFAFMLGVSYQVYFWGHRGATPGQRLMGIEVQGRDGTRPIGVRRAVARSLGWALSAAALGLGFLPILMGAEALHDRLARTRVVRRTRD